MEQPNKNISLTSITKLKLVLLPPKDKKEITHDNVISFYTDLIKIYAYGD